MFCGVELIVNLSGRAVIVVVVTLYAYFFIAAVWAGALQTAQERREGGRARIRLSPLQ